MSCFVDVVVMDMMTEVSPMVYSHPRAFVDAVAVVKGKMSTL